MAHSLEVREPLMDHPLVEWLATLPSSFKLRGGEGKWLFKKAMEPYLPTEVLYRPKMGFAVPLASWLRGPLRQRVRDAVLGDSLAETGFFDAGYLRQLVEQHQSGSRDHSAPLWSLLMFDAFLRQPGDDSETTRAPSRVSLRVSAVDMMGVKHRACLFSRRSFRALLSQMRACSFASGCSGLENTCRSSSWRRNPGFRDNGLFDCFVRTFVRWRQHMR